MTTNQQLVPFIYGDILTVRRDDNIYVVMPTVVGNIGLDWEPQRKRIERHPLMAEATSIMEVVTATGSKPTTVMSLECFHTFLVTLHPDRVTNVEVRERILTYQRRAFRAVFEHFHGPMRIASAKPASINDLLRVGAALKVETNRHLRALLWQEMDAITDSRGLSRCGRAIGFDEPDHADLLAEFWTSIRSLDELGIQTNHSRTNDQIALHLPTVREHFAEVGVAMEMDRTLRAALRQSTEPRFIADKPVNCRDGVGRRCWVFSALPDLFGKSV